MERQQITTSSNIASIGYDETTQTLEVKFLNGRVYHYYDVDVPYPIYQDLLTAQSHGKYLAAHVKGRYRYSKASFFNIIGVQITAIKRIIGKVKSIFRNFQYFRADCIPVKIKNMIIY
ncbi:MAG: KTSC domain-containing protein [Planctomycetaceae bacterium]|jgi:hypothetical protein|nr:KTSC domain-containing protein [Planctomycetaceae bacterium]